MKSALLLSLCTTAFAAAAQNPQAVLQDSAQAAVGEPEKYLIELSPGETRWITEDDKWALRRVCALDIYRSISHWMADTS